jgi:hypothetical protein
MNKREVVWLIIRLIGVYFAYLAIVSLLSLIGSIYNYASLPSPTPTPRSNSTRPVSPLPAAAPGINSPETDPATLKPEPSANAIATDKAKSEAFKLIFWYVLLTGLYAVAAWYLIRDGKYLFTVLNREDANAEEEEKKEPQVTSLNL